MIMIFVKNSPVSSKSLEHIKSFCTALEYLDLRGLFQFEDKKDIESRILDLKVRFTDCEIDC